VSGIPTVTLIAAPDETEHGDPVSISNVVLYIVVQRSGQVSMAGGLPMEYVPDVIEALNQQLKENPLELHAHDHHWPGDL